MKHMIHKNLLEQPGALQFLFDNHPDGICVINVDGQFLYVNTSMSTIFGYTQEELLQSPLNQLLQFSGDHGDIIENEKDQHKLVIQHKNGYTVYIKMTNIPLINDGAKSGFFIRMEDISKEVEQSKELMNIQEMFTLITEKSQNIISSFSADGVFTYISPTVKALLGYTPEEVIGKPAAFFNDPDTNQKFKDHRNALFIDQDTVRFTGRVRHKNGEYRWYETTAEYIRDHSGKIIQTIGVGRDITERKDAEEKVAHLAYHDSVTDLPNRRYFKQRVNQLLAKYKNECHVVMLLDLDGFKYVNDTFGHDIGDLLLIEVSKRITEAVGENGFVARWGGDEFTVLQSNIENQTDLDTCIFKIKQTLANPMILDGHTIYVTASIGVSFFREDGETIEELIKHADAEMYRAKTHSKTSH